MSVVGEKGTETSDGSAAAWMGKCQGWSKAVWEGGPELDKPRREAERRGCGWRETKRWEGVQRMRTGCGSGRWPLLSYRGHVFARGGDLQSLQGRREFLGAATPRRDQRQAAWAATGWVWTPGRGEA